MLNRCNLDMITKEAADTYNDIWHEWFPGGVSQAKLKIFVGDSTAPGFSPSLNEIHLPVFDGDIEDYDQAIACDMFAEENRWNRWKRDLVHEILHEYEHRVLTAPTSAGIRLRNSHRQRFSPHEQHGDLFYTAIAEKAAYFDMTEEGFRDSL